jgi:hypothetical protein
MNLNPLVQQILASKYADKSLRKVNQFELKVWYQLSDQSWSFYLLADQRWLFPKTLVWFKITNES